MADNTEAKFILNFESALAEIAKLGAAYDPPNPIADLGKMQAKHVQVRDLKTGHTRHAAVGEDKRNSREDLFKTIPPLCSSLISYSKSIGMDVNDLANLQSFLREIRGRRTKAYIRAVFGAKNAVYLAITKLKFRMPTRLA